jgi:hypothetical protein
VQLDEIWNVLHALLTTHHLIAEHACDGGSLSNSLMMTGMAKMTEKSSAQLSQLPES